MAPRLEFDKLAFFEDVGYEPHPGQLAIHRSTARHRIVACGVRWGKTLCAAMEALAAAIAPNERFVAWVCAPTYDLADRVFRQIQVVALEKLRHMLITIKESERRILIRNLAGGVSEIRAKSADNPDSLLGEGLDALILDEASRLKPHIWQGHLSQRLLDRQGWVLLISTPRGKGWFYDLFRRGQGADRDPDFESWNMPSWTNPLLDRQWIEAERERVPERTFRQEYGGEFIEGAGAVFRHVRECATGDWQDPKPKVQYFAGLDLARVQDFTVLTVVNTAREVVYLDRFHRLDWGQQAARILGGVLRYGNAKILCDTTGVGDPVHEALRKVGCRTEAYPFTAGSKSALVENLTQMLEERRVVLPRPELAPEMIDELEAYQYSVSDAGNIRTSAPSGQHDDCVLSLGLSLWLVRKEPGRPHCSTIGARRRRDLRTRGAKWVRLTGHEPW